MTYNPIGTILDPHMRPQALHRVTYYTIIHDTINSVFAAHYLRCNSLWKTAGSAGQPKGRSRDGPGKIRSQLVAFGAWRQCFPERRSKKKRQSTEGQQPQEQPRPNQKRTCFDE